MNRIDQLINRILENRLLTHVLYWTSMSILWELVDTSGHLNDILNSVIYSFCLLPAQLIAYYSLVYFLIPKFIYKKKYVSFFFLFLISAYITCVIARFSIVYVYETLTGYADRKDSIIEILTQLLPLVGSYFMRVYFLPLFTLLFKLVKDHFERKQKMESLKKDKANAELGFLKAQLHPHFLFNTLNNLYTLTLYKPDQAPDVVLKLGKILDYTMHQDKSKEIPIYKEIELIDDYIDLELLRYGDRLDFSFQQEIDNKEATIVPLVLLSIVENAFKHGASGDHGRPKIYIDLKVKNDLLDFQVFNSRPLLAQVDKTNFKKGIGMNNIKRQLVLIYPERHQFKIMETKDSFKVNVTIELNSIQVLALGFH